MKDQYVLNSLTSFVFYCHSGELELIENSVVFGYA